MADPQMLAQGLQQYGAAAPDPAQASNPSLVAAMLASQQSFTPPSQPEADPLDFTAKYNTPLPPKDQAAYDQWVAAQSKALGRNVGNDAYDYDLQGWYKANGPQDLSGAHLKDTFKKPNHPTFSDQSQYHGVDGYQGGSWQEVPNSNGRFQYNATQSNMYGPGQLQQYFQKYEPDTQLVLPPSR